MYMLKFLRVIVSPSSYAWTWWNAEQPSAPFTGILTGPFDSTPVVGPLRGRICTLCSESLWFLDSIWRFWKRCHCRRLFSIFRKKECFARVDRVLISVYTNAQKSADKSLYKVIKQFEWCVFFPGIPYLHRGKFFRAHCSQKCVESEKNSGKSLQFQLQKLQMSAKSFCVWIYITNSVRVMSWVLETPYLHGGLHDDEGIGSDSKIVKVKRIIKMVFLSIFAFKSVRVKFDMKQACGCTLFDADTNLHKTGS